MKWNIFELVVKRMGDRRRLLDLSDQITEPPCKFCLYWAPRIVLHQDGNYDGVSCCNVSIATDYAKMQCEDFSCFEEKYNAEGSDRVVQGDY